MNITPFDFDFDLSAETRTLTSILLTLPSVIPIVPFVYRYYATEKLTKMCGSESAEMGFIDRLSVSR